MELVQNIEGMEIVYQKPATLTDTPMHYCPGCGHGVRAVCSSTARSSQCLSEATGMRSTISAPNA